MISIKEYIDEAVKFNPELHKREIRNGKKVIVWKSNGHIVKDEKKKDATPEIKVGDVFYYENVFDCEPERWKYWKCFVTKIEGKTYYVSYADGKLKNDPCKIRKGFRPGQIALKSETNRWYFSDPSRI